MTPSGYYVACCVRCGGWRTSIADMPDDPRTTAKLMAQFIADGWQFQRVTQPELKAIGGCKCAQSLKPSEVGKPVQLELFAGGG